MYYSISSYVRMTGGASAKECHLIDVLINFTVHVTFYGMIKICRSGEADFQA